MPSAEMVLVALHSPRLPLRVPRVSHVPCEESLQPARSGGPLALWLHEYRRASRRRALNASNRELSRFGWLWRNRLAEVSARNQQPRRSLAHLHNMSAHLGGTATEKRDAAPVGAAPPTATGARAARDI